MSSHDLQSSRQIWTEYWRSGRAGCLTDDAPPSARERIRDLWRDWFLRQTRGARILDLACGAGDVARIALSVGSKARLEFTIEGVDLAELDGVVETHAAADGTTLRLQGGTDLARLPFSDLTFECAVSQFGIEYVGNTSAACAELVRVLRKDGQGLFLVHHDKSAISEAAALRLRAYDSLMGDGSLVDSAKTVYQGMAARAPDSAIARQLSEFRQSLRPALTTHNARFAWETNLREVLGFLSDLARNPTIYDPQDALRRIDVARDMIAAWRSRLQSQLSAARDERGIKAFADGISGCGLRPSQIDMVNDPATGAVLAWRLAFEA